MVESKDDRRASILAALVKAKEKQAQARERSDAVSQQVLASIQKPTAADTPAEATATSISALPAVESNPFLVPASQQLLAEQREEVRERFSADAIERRSHAGELHSVDQLAELDPEAEGFVAETQKVYHAPENVKAARLTDAMVLDSPDSVRALCDEMDRLLTELSDSGGKIIGPPLFQLRNYVQQLMVTLLKRPEFDSVVIDTDIRNVFKFIRATREQTLKEREIKTEKSAVRKIKTASTNKRKESMAAAFAALQAGQFKFVGALGGMPKPDGEQS